MATDRDCIDNARECVRLAGLTDEPDIREYLSQLARNWMVAARHEDDARGPSALSDRSLTS